MLADKVRPYRVKNLVATMQKTDRILRDAGLPANAVPPRLLLPIIENCSVEDNETLQEMWAGLSATASQETGVRRSPSFVETLKQLTPDEARYFEKIVTGRATDRLGLTTLLSYAFARNSGAPPGASETFERLGLIRRNWGMAEETANTEAEVGYLFALTNYAKSFLDACHGPRPSPQT